MFNKSKKIARVSPECVACGCCLKTCPLGAVSVLNGIRASVDTEKCVGCGKCEAVCPACVISLEARPEAGQTADDGGDFQKGV